ncbi:MAG: C-GCAxxG-C-C family protein [Solirubrobacterales bacterium]
MSRVDDAVQCFCRGAACSQAIVAHYGPAVGLPAEQGLKLASGFAGGMRMAQTCGAVTGAFMVLGLKHAAADCEQRSGRDRVYAAIQEFTAKFQERKHTVLCKELLGCDISQPEGLRRATQDGLFRTICPKLVQDAAEILEEML